MEGSVMLVTVPSRPKAAGIGSSPWLWHCISRSINNDSLWCRKASLVTWAVQPQCVVCKPVRRIKVSILSQLQKKPFRSIIHPWWVAVLISLPHVSPQTTSTRGRPCPLHNAEWDIWPMSGNQYQINSNPPPPQKKKIKDHSRLFFFHLILHSVQTFFFFLLWLTCNQFLWEVQGEDTGTCSSLL